MTLSSSPIARRLTVAAGALALALAAAGPAQAADRGAQLRADQPGAQRALRAADAIAQGRGVRGGRELSPALASLAGRTAALSPADKAAANELLARPTDPDQTGQPGGPYTVPDLEAYDPVGHYCYHWVETTEDAPPMTDADDSGIPDYVEQMADVFETVWDAEHGDLQWRLPNSDGTRGGCTWDGAEGLTDVYVKDIGELGLYGYASPDPGQPSTDKTRYAFLVMDDDYAKSEFPGYDDPEKPLKVTAAHEYNHVVQYAYDILQDKWMFESTATWMEEKVYPEIDDYHQYIAPWAQRSAMPITLAESSKMYGSAVFNRWLDDEYGEEIVRRAWERSTATGDFAPGAYDAAIREANGPGFSYELINLAASTAEWQTADSRVHEGAAFPEMKRIPGQLKPDGTSLTGKLDHTGFAMIDVALTNAPKITLSGGLPSGVAGGIALVGRDGGDVWKALGVMPQGGPTSVTIDNPGRFERLTAVVINADAKTNGWNGQDWVWRNDQVPVALKITEGSGGGDPDPGTEDPGGGGEQQPGGGGSRPTPPIRPITPVNPPAPAVQLSKGALPRLKKATALTVTAGANTGGRISARATVDAKTAKALGLGRRAATIGSGKATLASAGTAKVKVKLTGKARARLKRSKKAVTVTVQVTFTPSSGSPVTSTLKLRLKP